jgi:predicted exporter
MYFAAWDDYSLDAALEYNKALFPALDSLKETGLVKAYSPVTRMVLQSEKDQLIRIKAWNNFWNRRRVARVKRDLGAAAHDNSLPYNLFDPFLGIVTAKYQPDNLYDSGVVPPGLLSNYVERQENGRYMVFTDVSYELKDQDTVWDALAVLPHIIVLEPFYYCRDLVEVVHDDFSTTLWISSIFVLLVLLISFRNIWISLIAFLPMFLSWYVMQGYMALLGLEFNLINIVIATFIFGVGVDYSIFITEGLLSEARTGSHDVLTWHKVAISFSAIILVIVVTSLLFAVHPAIRSIGLITLIGMASTIMISYALQPFVFRQMMKWPWYKRSVLKKKPYGKNQ